MKGGADHTNDLKVMNADVRKAVPEVTMKFMASTTGGIDKGNDHLATSLPATVKRCGTAPSGKDNVKSYSAPDFTGTFTSDIYVTLLRAVVR